MQIDLIKPYNKNAKIHSKRQIEQIANSIKEFGFNQSLVVDKENTIIVGHGRYEAAKLLGLTDVPVIQIDLSEEKAKAYRLADNKLNESDWEMGLVIEELKGLTLELVDLTGFDRDLLIESDERDDLVPDNAPPVAKIGDLWALGRHRLMCGDSTSKEAVERLTYGVDIGAKNRFLNTFQRAGRNLKDVANDVIGKDALYDMLVFAFTNCKDSMKDGASFYVTAPQGGELGLMMMMMMKNAGLPARHVLNWVKNTATFSMGRLDYEYKHEPILYGWKKTHSFYGGGTKTSVWEFNKPMSNKLHPTMKPVELINNAILNSSKEEDIILDLFGGSGSTLIACEKTNRICYMMEIEPEYCDVIIKRWEDYVGSGAKATKLN